MFEVSYTPQYPQGEMLWNGEIIDEPQSIFEAILQRVATEYSGIEVRTSTGRLGNLKYEFVKDEQALLTLHQNMDGYWHSWQIQFAKEGLPILRDLTLELFRETGRSYSGAVSPQIENFYQTLETIKRVAASHPEIVLEEGPKTGGDRKIDALSNGELVAWFTWDKYDWRIYEWRFYQKKGGVPFIRDFEIELNKETGRSLPDWIKTEIEEKEQQTGGRKRLACNLWLDHLVNEKGWAMGNDDDKNELFKIWKMLWKVETGKDPDNPSEAPDPWDSYRKAVGERGKNRKK